MSPYTPHCGVMWSCHCFSLFITTPGSGGETNLDDIKDPPDQRFLIFIQFESTGLAKNGKFGHIYIFFDIEREDST